MNALTKSDLALVASRIPKDVRELLSKDSRLFIGGGLIRSVIAGEEVHDIDMFGPDITTLKLAAQSLALTRKVSLHETKNAITLVTMGRLPVQFITRWVFADLEALTSSFDFTVCQAGIRRNEKWESVCSPAFYADLAARRLVYTSPKRDEEAGGSMMRMRKFLARGYNIQALSMASVIARLYHGIDPAKVDLGDEVAVAVVLTGLLREVDPLLVVDGLELVDEHEPEIK